MPHYLVKQPNNLYAIYSTIIEDFVALNLTVQKAIDYELQHSLQRIDEDRTSLDYSMEIYNTTVEEAKNIEDTGRAWPWAQTFKELLPVIWECSGPESISKLINIGIVSEQTVQKILEQSYVST